MREQGLSVESARGDVHARPTPTATDDPAAIGPVRRQSCSASSCGTSRPRRRRSRRWSPTGGVVIPFQNGVEAPDGPDAGRWAPGQRAGRRRVHRGDDRRAGRHRAHRDRWRGCASAPSQAATGGSRAAFVDAARAAGIDAELSPPTSARALWEKFVFLVRVRRACTCLSAAADRHAVAPTPTCARRSRRDARRRGSSARAQGVALGDEFVARADAAAATGCRRICSSSMLNDLTAGNRLEAPWLSARVARMAAQAGLAAPVNATLYAAVEALRQDGPRAAAPARPPSNSGGESSCDSCSSGSSTRVALLALPYVFPVDHTSTRSSTALVAALVLGLVNTLIRPILVLLTLPVDAADARSVHLRHQRPPVLVRSDRSSRASTSAVSGRGCSARSSTA